MLTIALLSMCALSHFPLTAIASPTTLVWLTHWTEPEEVAYWDAVLAAYKAETGVEVRRDAVEFEALYETIMLRHAAGEDPDIIHQHAMWLPTFANWQTHIISVPPSVDQANVRAYWTPSTTSGSTYKSIVWGYPSEFNSWALVYNRALINARIGELSDPDKTTLQNVLNKLEADTPLSYTELTNSAKLLTKWNTTVSPYVATQTGFVPFIEGMPEEQRYQFMSLLWSNGGEYVDLTVPEALFDSTNGYQVMQLYHNLGFVEDTDPAPGIQPVYDPLNIPDYWYSAWQQETIGMMILPTWMTYVRGAMGDNFGHLGISPIPIGPSGTTSKSVTYNWLNTVTQRAEDEGRATEAWNFLRWLNEPKPAGYIAALGRPIGDQVSMMGDFLIYDSIVPSRTTDLTNGEVEPGVLLASDFWFSEFIKFGSPPYGRADKPFLKSEEAQYQMGLMFEKVTLLGEDPTTAVNDAAAAIEPPPPVILPMAGDINIDGPVNVGDAVPYILDFWATPTDPNWNRGRSDIDDSGQVKLADGGLIVKNWGKVGGSL